MRNGQTIALSAAGLMLLGVYADWHLFHTPAVDSGPYLAHVRAVADSMPTTIGDWTSTETPIPRSAVALLHPNITLSRAFNNPKTGQHASLLLVQCEDSRDLLGHYPPVCYPNAGYVLLRQHLQDWALGDLTIHGTEYEFTSLMAGRSQAMVVDDFLITPDGQTCPNMDGVYTAARDFRKRSFGAAHVQLITDAAMAPQTREQVFKELIGAHRPLIEAIGAGIKP